MQTIYFIIFILFAMYIVFTWNSTKEFETIISRISFVIIGTLFISLFTLVLFYISKIGVVYPKEEMIGQIRKIVLLVFIPINGFLTLTQLASIFAKAKSDMISKEELSKKIKIFAIIFIVLIIIECIYLKRFQVDIIEMMNNMKK